MTALNVTYRITRRLPIGEASTLLHINTGAINSGTLADLVKERKGYPDITATLAPSYDNPAPDLDPVTGAPLNGNQSEVNSPVTFYLFDHLGNTRVTFRADAPNAISITYAADYYPYGKILREYNCTQNRYLSTHHERDVATGYDNRGARLYDSEIGRFLGVDPMAGKFQGHSPYNYVMGNPISLVDPDGLTPEPPGSVFFIGIELRGNFVATVSVTGGIIVDTHGNAATFTTVSGGGGLTFGGSGAVVLGGLTSDNIYEAEGWGVNLGLWASGAVPFANFAGEINTSVETEGGEFNGDVQDIDVGGTWGTPAGIGIGFGLYADVSKTTFHQKVTLSEALDYMINLLKGEGVDVTPEELAKVIKKSTGVDVNQVPSENQSSSENTGDCGDDECTNDKQ